MKRAMLADVFVTRASRRGVSGCLAGAIAGVVLTLLLGPVGIALGVLVGAVFGLLFQPVRGMASAGFTGAAVGIPLWLIVQLFSIPVVTGGTPKWTPAGVQASLPALGLWLVAGSLIGCTTEAAYRVLFGAESQALTRSVAPDDPTRVVILGGGFAGLYAARQLEQLFGADPTVELTVVSRDNATLFTPMLPEVAGGNLAPTEVTTPLRTALKRTRVIEAAVEGVDFEEQRINIDLNTGPRGWDADSDVQLSANSEDSTQTVSYDHLVLALGSTPDDKGIDPTREFVLDFKSLGDAIRIRNHILACFERADATDDSSEQQQLTRFLIAGGGFAGTELAGAVNDFAHGIVTYYPSVQRSDIEVVVVHSQSRILPELNEGLAEYARRRMRARGIRFELDVYLTDVSAEQAVLSDGRTLDVGTIVWTAGNKPHPLLTSLDIPERSSGAVAVDQTLSVPERTGVWAAGDCAAMRDPETDEPYPNTAQYAIRAGAAVAKNIHATTEDREPKPFAHQSQGSLAVIGHQVAVADIMGWRFSGRIAWLLWRIIYLTKIPGLAQKARVLISWITDLFLPRDIVRTVDTTPYSTQTTGEFHTWQDAAAGERNGELPPTNSGQDQPDSAPEEDARPDEEI